MNSLPILDGNGSNVDLATTIIPSGAVTHHALGANDLCLDAWGRQKIVNDYTMFAGLWSFNVPNRQWVAFHQDTTNLPGGFVEVGEIPKDNTGTHIKSYNGMLSVKADTDFNVHLQSKRHMRYQPNKGFLYSTAVILPDPTNVLYTRHFGVMGGRRNGLYFELIGTGSAFTLNVVRRRHIGTAVEEFKTDITASLPDGFDMSKGHVYDIQAQWRGVGNIKFFIDLALIHTEELLGTLDAMSVSNPSFHVGWSAFGDGAEILAGCVDVSSEGGYREQKLYTSATSGDTLLSCRKDGGNSTALLGLRIPTEITYNGSAADYTRDLLINRMSPFGKDEMVISVWAGREINLPNLAGVSLFQDNEDSYWQSAIEDTGTDELDIAFQLDKANMRNVYAARLEKDVFIPIQMTGREDLDYYMTAGDIMIFAFKPDGNSQLAGITVEMSEEM